MYNHIVVITNANMIIISIAGLSRVFRDVVFQDVGFQRTMFKTPQPYQR